MLSIGLMSGTSMDGIDAALIETDGKNLIKAHDHIILYYDTITQILLKSAELAVRRNAGNLLAAEQDFPDALHDYLKHELSLDDQKLAAILKKISTGIHDDETQAVSLSAVIAHSTALHAEAVALLLQKTRLSARDIDVIGYHGQTLFHSPAQKITLQVGSGECLAQLTGITTVNDFRSQDVAAGGQGAPFAPLYHQALAVRDKKIPVAVVNCGGIANITIVEGDSADEIIGFDTGPGNGLIDRCVKYFTQGREHMDTHGKYGKLGNAATDLFPLLYDAAINTPGKNFFNEAPPKSLDIGDLNFIAELKALTLPDACRTLAAFTADSIVRSLEFVSVTPKYWILAGGGWKNPVIYSELAARLQAKNHAVTLLTADAAGWNSQALEAQLFAYLAVRSLQQLPISFPAITRVPTPLCGGVTHLAPLGPTPAVAKVLEKISN